MVTSSSAPTSRELLTVDLRGLKPALIERARADGVPVSALVRQALLALLQERSAHPLSGLPHSQTPVSSRVRVSLHLARDQRDQLRSRAAASGLPVGAYVVALMRQPIEPPSAADRAARTAALVRSNAELATLSRNIARLTALLRHGAAREAQQYRQSLDALDTEVRTHLALASDVLAQDHVPRRHA
ncbi:MAG: hypothetical protein KIT60_03430 [Burkholderiaceae bacterium]|nr:hypothetical protein [Burkholderiaceae bacterium]